MRKLMKLQWQELRARLLELGDDAEPEVIFTTLVAGFRRYRPQFSSKPFSDLRFARYFGMRAADYPLAQSALRDAEFRHFKAWLVKYEVRGDLGAIAGLLDEAMRRLLTPHIEQCCPRCGHEDFAIYKSLATRQLVLECGTCFHVQGRHGEPHPGGPITFASAADLRLPGRPAAPVLALPAQLAPRIRVDFGEMLDYNLVVLSRRNQESARAGVLLDFYRGQPVAIVDDDIDEHGLPGHLIADGHAEPAMGTALPPWAADAAWLCRIDKRGIRRLPAPG